MISRIAILSIVAVEGLSTNLLSHQEDATNERSPPFRSVLRGSAKVLRLAGAHGPLQLALRKLVSMARRTRSASPLAKRLGFTQASNALEAEFGDALHSLQAGTFCDRLGPSANKERKALMSSDLANHTSLEGTVCITLDPYERAVAEYKTMVARHQSMHSMGGQRAGLYDQPVCSDAGLNSFLQTTVAAIQRGIKLLPDCHFTPQSKFIWHESGPSVCQHRVKEQELLASLRKINSSSQFPLKVLVDFRDTSNSRICPGLSAAALAPDTRRLLDAVYEADFERLNYTRSQQNMVFIHIPRSVGPSMAVKASAASQVVWPANVPSLQAQVVMRDGSLCTKQHVPPKLLAASDAQVYAQADSMCVVRHPFERAVTEYVKLLESGERGSRLSESYGFPLEIDGDACSAQGLNRFVTESMRLVQRGRKFAMNCHLVPQVDYIWGSDSRQWCRNLLRAEELPGAFQRLMEKKGYSHIQLGPWSEPRQLCQNLSTKALSREAKELLFQVYTEDFERLGYLRPMQLTAAKMELEAVAGHRLMPEVASPVVHSFEQRRQPSVFVAVFSRRDDGRRRHFVRQMWGAIKRRSLGKVTYRFVLCRAPGDGVWMRLVAENNTFGDLVTLPCGEGYQQGLLTEKVLASMWAYKEHFFKHNYFMKIDDDAFVSWAKYSEFIASEGSAVSYMGVPIGQSIPCRNSSYRWYEPYETFPQALFPLAMAGGAGYVLGKRLVQGILESGVGEANVLYNEDRAVGVWINSLVESGMKVEYQSVLGIDGWWAWDWKRPYQNWHRWSEYPYFVHHGLRAATISCLSRMDELGEPDADVSQCFLNEVGVTHEPLKCAEETAQKLAPP